MKKKTQILLAALTLLLVVNVALGAYLSPHIKGKPSAWFVWTLGIIVVTASLNYVLAYFTSHMAKNDQLSNEKKSWWEWWALAIFYLGVAAIPWYFALTIWEKRRKRSD